MPDMATSCSSFSGGGGGGAGGGRRRPRGAPPPDFAEIFKKAGLYFDAGALAKNIMFLPTGGGDDIIQMEEFPTHNPRQSDEHSFFLFKNLRVANLLDPFLQHLSVSRPDHGASSII
jgi:hypothetical protein